MTPQVLILGGYGAVGQHVARTLVDAGVRVVIGGRRREPAQQLADELPDATPAVVDVSAPATVQAAAARVDAVVNCSGAESLALVDAVLDVAHLVDVSASYGYQQAVATRVAARPPSGREGLFSVGIAPGLTNLVAAAVQPAGQRPIEILVVLGVSEDHGRAARDWVYGLLGRRFPDTTGLVEDVRNFSGRVTRVLPGLGTSWLYRVDFSDQHVLTADLHRRFVTYHGPDSRLAGAVMAVAARAPAGGRVLRAVEPVVPWSLLGSDRWVVAAGVDGAIDHWAGGRNQSRASGVVAALATLAVLEDPSPGTTHLHQRTSLAALAPELKRHDIEVGSREASP